MKKLSLIISVFLLLFLLCSCTNESKECNKIYNRILEVNGIDNFKNNEGNYELNVYLLPTDDFINRFDYTDIDYHYREHYESYVDFVGYEKSIVVIKYEEEIYEQAKQFCFEEMNLSETYTLKYNTNVFIENIELGLAQNRYSEDFVYTFPKRFNMLAYNDSLNCLIFLGFYCPDYTNEEAMLIIKNWGQFLNHHFSDVYDFGDDVVVADNTKK